MTADPVAGIVYPTRSVAPNVTATMKPTIDQIGARLGPAGVKGSWILGTIQAVATATFVQLATATASGAVSGVTNSGGAVTVPSAGDYEVTVEVNWDGPTTSSRRVIVITNNCSSINSAGIAASGVVTDSQQMMFTLGGPQALKSKRIACAAGDVLRAFVFQDSGASLNVIVGASNNFSGLTSLQVARVVA